MTFKHDCTDSERRLLESRKAYDELDSENILLDEQLKQASKEIDRQRDQLKIIIDALKVVDKFWFQPSPEKGCCCFCDAGLHPDWLDKHEPTCEAQIAHDALNHIGAID